MTSKPPAAILCRINCHTMSNHRLKTKIKQKSKSWFRFQKRQSKKSNDITYLGTQKSKVSVPETKMKNKI